MNKPTTAEGVQMMATPSTCKCDICQRTTRYGQVISKLDSEDDQRFMLELYELLTHLEFDHEQSSGESLRTGLGDGEKAAQQAAEQDNKWRGG